MAALIALALFLAFYLALAVGIARDTLPDTRDPEWSMGRLLRR